MTAVSDPQTQFLLQWLGREALTDLPAIAWGLLPDPSAENWFRAAVLRAHETLQPQLCLQAIFGLAVPLEHDSLGSGDWLCEQLSESNRGRALCVHDEPYTWSDGGPAGYDASEVDDFVTEWLDEEEALDELAEALDELAEEAAEGEPPNKEELPEEQRELADKLLAEYREALPMGGHVPDIIGARTLNETLELLAPAEHQKSPSAELATLTSASWVVAALMGQAQHLPTGQAFEDRKRSIESWVADPASATKGEALLNLWAAFFLDVEVAGAVAGTREHAWRVLRDSATLIEALLEDPKIGAVDLVRRPDLAAG